MLSRKMIILGFFVALLLGGCQPEPVVPTSLAAESPSVETLVETALAEQMPTEVMERTLVVCLGQEPSTLYLYRGASYAMWSVLEAVYDGPIDTRGFSPEPIILTTIPSITGGDAIYTSQDVQAGSIVVDANGEVAVLAEGVMVLPSGCNGSECAVAWNNMLAVQMDQLVLNFKLQPGITWSDGTPLTAADSVYSYNLSGDPATTTSEVIFDRTASYSALDEQTVQWVGIPGYAPVRYEAHFWHPLPQHAWGHLSAEQLLTADESNRRPLGWGPFIIDEWVDGDHITLRKNSNYHRADEGLPNFDTLVYRFLGRPGDSNLNAITTGECDIIDRTAGLDEEVQQVRGQEIEGNLKMYLAEGPEWEQVVFGVKSAVFDDVATAEYDAQSGKVDFFSDLRMRQAFAYCMDREHMIEYLLFNHSTIPTSYLPPSHPLYQADLPYLPFDSQAGSDLLDEVGWRDADNNPATPREAFEIPNIPDGTPLSVTYATTEARLRQEVAYLLAESMADCGIQVEVQPYNPMDLYAAGPEGLVFGRNFDLAQLAWKAGFEPACYLYMSDQIPTEENYWLGVNVTGYSNPAYDAVCQTALQTRMDQPEYQYRHQDAQQLFAEELPAVPLYFRLQVAASRPDLCGMSTDISARSDLMHLEQVNYGEMCLPE
jgi:peptide/nickel transport system substrate-binding protein